MALSIFGVVPWLDFLYLLSYIKLALTLVKCIPQVYLNYVRKSTTGWSIINVIMDCVGGVFSIMQILIDCWISGHWSGITGFLIKLALGIISLVFDAIFLMQHYVWFPEGHGPHLVVDQKDIETGSQEDLYMAEARPTEKEAEMYRNDN
jgi:cystinosin